ncbi:uncharacterized protein LOC144716135 isoform X2 [Wolffia australiana]
MLKLAMVVTNSDHTSHRKSCPFSTIAIVTTIFLFFSIGCVFLAADYSTRKPLWVNERSTAHMSKICQKRVLPQGSETLPRGIVKKTSDLQMQPLYGPREEQENSGTPKNLLAIPAGIKQKNVVNQIVEKFLGSQFQVIIFHYDGIIDEWHDFHWCDRAIHVSAINQTKWWFAKRFLHPDIVADYDYIFLWDEDLGVENFHPGRYLKIVRNEGLEISQPALDTTRGLRVHYLITARQQRKKLHRRIFKLSGGSRCYGNSTGPPCTGWVEMMAPVFSRSAWRCVWYMIQNDLIHAWGLDYKLGYCAQGERSKKIGVVDAEYIVHKGIPTLGGFDLHTSIPEEPVTHSPSEDSEDTNNQVSSPAAPGNDDRVNVRLRSAAELEIFTERWRDAVHDDECWADPYPEKIK